MKSFLISVSVLLLMVGGCSTAPNSKNTDPPKTPDTAMPALDANNLCFYGCPENLYDTLLENIGYKTGYSESHKDPLWSAYYIDVANNRKYGKRPSRFKTDERTRAKVTHNDYTHSGYNRGHMAPNYAIAVTAGREAQLETFYMSNICPQLPKHNQQIWRRLEELAAKNYSARFGRIWVITGPVFDKKPKHLKSGVDIPVGFYKIIIRPSADAPPDVIAFYIPQNADPNADLAKFLVSVDKIEQLTGLDFMNGLPDTIENQVESTTAAALW